MTRTDIINTLIRNNDLNSYLEIGVFDGENFKHVKAKRKVAVDPVPLKSSGTTHPMTSDEFFAQNNQKFQVVFIDGLHYAEQALRDIENAMKILSPGGFVVVHDVNPPTQLHAAIPRTTEIAEWNGDVYKAFIQARSIYEPQWMFKTVNTDWGVGIITRRSKMGHKRKPPLLSNEPIKDIPWEFFDKNREGCLNLISVEDFKRIYDSH